MELDKIYSVEDIDNIFKAVEYVVFEFASTREGRVKIAQKTNLGISYIRKLQVRKVNLDNVNNVHFMTLFRFYVEHIQKNN